MYEIKIRGGLNMLTRVVFNQKAKVVLGNQALL